MPDLGNPVVVWTAVAYLTAVLLIGLWAGRRTRDTRDFFIAGQRLGLFVTGLATMSAAFSGFIFVGGPGLTYRLGVVSFFLSVPVGITSGLLCWSVGKRLRLLSEVRQVLTLPDAIFARFNSRLASGLAAAAILIGTVGYLGAQFQALGIVIEAIFGTEAILGSWSLAFSMGVGVVVVVVYAVMGGMIAGVYTDVLQGILMLGAAVAVFYYALESGDGLQKIIRRIASSPRFGEDFLDPFGGLPLVTAIGFFFVFSVGTLGQPHMLHKFYMLDDPRKLKWMPLMIGSTQAICLLIWVGIGLAVPALVAAGELAPLARPDDASALFLVHFTPPLVAGLVFAGILAAVMSTADSLMNIGSAALVRDLPHAFGKVLKKELAWGRAAVGLIAVTAAVFSYAYDDLIALLGTFAFGTFGAALAPCLVIGLNWKRVTAAAAAASIATGTGLSLGLEFLSKQNLLPDLPRVTLPSGVLPGAVALAASFTILFAVTWLQGSRDGGDLADDVALVMDI